MPTGYTWEMLDALKSAYASGVTSVRFPDGRGFTRGSLPEMAEAIRQIERSLQGRRRIVSGTAGYRRHP